MRRRAAVLGLSHTFRTIVLSTWYCCTTIRDARRKRERELHIHNRHSHFSQRVSRVRLISSWVRAAAKMAVTAHAYYYLLLSCCCCCWNINVIQAQDSQGRYYNPAGAYGPQPPNSPSYNTYFYKDRRYGYQPSYLDPWYNRGPTRSPEDRFQYDVSNLFIYLFFFYGTTMRD